MDRMRRHDSGETLIEILISVAILGIAVSAILGGLATLVMGTDIHRKQSAATAVLLGAAEIVKDSSTPYVVCAIPSDYQAAIADLSRVPRPSGWPAPQIVAQPDGVKYWNGTTFSSTCTDSDLAKLLTPLQLITISVSSPDGRDTETISVVKRRTT